MKKEIIIRPASDLFTSYGIKGVSMNMISKSVRISKKTIYEQFKDKESLVFECVKTETEKYRNKIEDIESKSDSLIGTIISIHIELYRQSLKWCPAFSRDLEFYPEARSQLYDNYILFIHSKCSQFIQKGIKEEIFNHDTDTDLIHHFFGELLKSVRQRDHSDKTNSMDTYIMTISTFLTGISTDKGRTDIEKYMLKYKLNNNNIKRYE